MQFYDKGHIYMLGEKRLPCVSDLCRFLHKEIYREAPTWQMELAADRGTAVHLATEQLDKAGTAEIDESYAPYLKAYAAFLRDHKPQWEMVERSMYHPDDMYAGTIDRYGMVDDLKTLLDIKTTYSVYKPLCSASLSLYERMLKANGVEVERRMILHLRKNGTYKLIPFEHNEELACALITLHKTLIKKKKGEHYV